MVPGDIRHPISFPRVSDRDKHSVWFRTGVNIALSYVSFSKNVVLPEVQGW